jgi:hypothetical protein
MSSSALMKAIYRYNLLYSHYNSRISEQILMKISTQVIPLQASPKQHTVTSRAAICEWHYGPLKLQAKSDRIPAFCLSRPSADAAAIYRWVCVLPVLTSVNDPLYSSCSILSVAWLPKSFIALSLPEDHKQHRHHRENLTSQFAHFTELLLNYATTESPC